LIDGEGQVYTGVPEKDNLTLILLCHSMPEKDMDVLTIATTPHRAGINVLIGVVVLV
jgi:hypothetical protein